MTVPFPSPETHNHKESRKYRDKDSKLPVEEDAGIHSKNHSLMDALHHVFFCSVGLPVQFPCKAMAWIEKKKIHRAATPKNSSRNPGEVGSHDPLRDSSMK